MFETLTDKLTAVINSVANKGRLTEKDIDDSLKEVRRALLEADVNFKVSAAIFVKSALLHKIDAHPSGDITE